MLRVFFGIAQAIVHQVPVQSVHPGVGMATGTGLPMLETEVGIVEEPLAAPLGRQRRRGTEPAIWPTGCGVCGFKSTTASVSPKYSAT